MEQELKKSFDEVIVFLASLGKHMSEGAMNGKYDEKAACDACHELACTIMVLEKTRDNFFGEEEEA